MDDGVHTWIRYDSATMRARELRLSFISLISLSTSSMNLRREVDVSCSRVNVWRWDEG